MSEVLTQEEINALLAQFAKADEAAEKPKESIADGRAYRVYDFKRPNRFSRDQLRTIHMLHETFARYLSTALSGHLRTAVKVSLTDVQQRIYDEYLSALKSPAVLYIFSAEPLDGKAIIELNPYIVFVMIDRLMGGQGRARGRVRELTEIEETLVRTMMTRAMRNLKDAWETMVSLTPHIDQYESNPQFAQIVSPNDTVCLMTFEVKVGEASGSMSMCIPHSTLQPVLLKLSAQQWYQKARKITSPKSTSTIAAGLERVRVPVTARLGTAEVTVREALDLDIGDVIMLNERAGQEITVIVGNTPKFRAIPGLVSRRIAVQVTEVVSSEQ
ncbi:MAG: flagellar motor switch protein FliM [Firmicutes bacterium]|jgi:flagellar motor switch protein FliM|nr:flagellar motor switch protein FliM [Bacillota bacterium]